MAKAWYDAQIVGVVFGAILGFVLSDIRSRIDRRRSHRSFRKILRMEIEQITLRLASHRKICVECMNQITDKKLHPQSLGHQLSKGQIYSWEYPTGFFKSNLDKLTPFPSTVAQPLVAFYAQVEECQRRMDDLEKENPSDKYVSPKQIPAGQPQHPDSLKKACMLLGSATQKGEELIRVIDREDGYWERVRQFLSKGVAKTSAFLKAGRCKEVNGRGANEGK